MKVCTIGGNVAECAGGPRCLKYGVTRDYILGLELVLPDGQVTWVGSKFALDKGLDLVRLLVGSEGMLGDHQIMARIKPLPEAKNHVGNIQYGGRCQPVCVRYYCPRHYSHHPGVLDNLLINCAEDFAKIGLPRMRVLF